MTARWLDTPTQWASAAAVVRAASASGDPVGWDSETYGHDVTETTAPHRAVVHVWSLGVLTATRHPRGHRVASGAVFPLAAMVSGPLREVLEDPAVTKVAWNAPHDVHSAGNHGVTVRSAVDGLQRLRVLRPDLQRHGLKSVCGLVGRTLTPFETVLTRDEWHWAPGTCCACEAPDHVWWTEPAKVGSLGVERTPCRRRSAGHSRVACLLPKHGPRLQALESVVPGHVLFTGLVNYAAEDAICAVELWDAMERMNDKAPPWMEWAPEWRTA